MSVYLTTLFFAAIRAVYLYSAACFFLASGRGAWCWDGFSEIVFTLHNIHSAIMIAIWTALTHIFLAAQHGSGQSLTGTIWSIRGRCDLNRNHITAALRSQHGWRNLCRREDDANEQKLGGGGQSTCVMCVDRNEQPRDSIYIQERTQVTLDHPAAGGRAPPPKWYLTVTGQPCEEQIGRFGSSWFDRCAEAMLIVPLRYQSSHTGKHPVSLSRRLDQIIIQQFARKFSLYRWAGSSYLSARTINREPCTLRSRSDTGSPPLPFEHLKLWIMSLMTHVGPPTI
jgi:hypothetical protein